MGAKRLRKECCPQNVSFCNYDYSQNRQYQTCNWQIITCFGVVINTHNLIFITLGNWNKLTIIAGFSGKKGSRSFGNNRHKLSLFDLSSAVIIYRSPSFYIQSHIYKYQIYIYIYIYNLYIQVSNINLKQALKKPLLTSRDEGRIKKNFNVLRLVRIILLSGDYNCI